MKNERWEIYKQYHSFTYHYLATADFAEVEHPAEDLRPISVCKQATNSYKVERIIYQIRQVVPNEEVPYLFPFSSAWNTIKEGLTEAVNDPSILLDKYNISEEKCNNLAKGITEETACVVSDGSFNPKSSIGPAGTSSVILAPSETSESSQCVTGANWITGTKEDQSAYRSEL